MARLGRYGYITNTKIKFVVVVKDAAGDTHVRSVSHTCFCSLPSTLLFVCVAVVPGNAQPLCGHDVQPVCSAQRQDRVSQVRGSRSERGSEASLLCLVAGLTRR